MLRVACFTLLALVSAAAAVPTATAASPLDAKQDWGEISADDRVVTIRVESLPPNNLIELPRLNNRMKSLTVDGRDDTLKFWPDIETWEIRLPKDFKLPATIRFETIEPIRLQKRPFVVRQQADGDLVLPAHHATTHGEKLRFEPQPHKNTVGYWTIESDWAEWSFELKSGGEFACEILQGCGKGNGGSSVDILVLDKEGNSQAKVSFVVEDTGHFQNFKPRNIGSLKLEPGQYRLEVRPKKKAKNAVADIRRISLLAK